MKYVSRLLRMLNLPLCEKRKFYSLYFDNYHKDTNYMTHDYTFAYMFLILRTFIHLKPSFRIIPTHASKKRREREKKKKKLTLKNVQY